ncbi:MAG: 3-hydroxyacyl-CoA dehydrogenase [Rhodospirillaceae bacterium]|jgi:3-hydroxybutyryl-CoA dehydrogenase|nr:3-hydroxyacyl-CoA dehydrogenase [Rhodospirillaceae bacterium]MBT3490686.1 3-hydroxyacyl-CoA dehydrogenase [Rhodospirillaceae bacterium]MBT3781681.1 3-hydroxyacyl-CoA dehydrogenase [Rhodospirillaceae bacterium]MBT3978474.1 3-hydroxyacyl-CoA dehydrogenase [Rhodospirillaceae bacterium]MBT4169799.1 3-hydroxyacyl-CoA dehydrogenase [Rhodospirillaceae bacterium]
MTLDHNQEGLVVGVIGAGAMGRGIAQVAAMGGCAVKLYDANGDSSLEALAQINGLLTRAADKGRMSAEEAEAAVARIDIIGDMGDFSPCDVVVEAVIEDIDIKRQVFAALEGIVRADAVLATNTSSLSVTTIAAQCANPERVAGLHFFNPVPVMKLVEVVAGVRTAPWVTEFLTGLGARMGRVPVNVADVPGFLVNQVGRGYTIEAAHMLSENIAEPVDFDRIMRDAAGFRMGPFELLDLTALDVTHPATEAIYGQHFHEPRYRPSSMMKTRMDAGLLGRKTKQGYYLYDEGAQQIPEETAAPRYDGRPVWVSTAAPKDGATLNALVETLGGKLEASARPSAEALILVTPLGKDATATAIEQDLDAGRTVAVDMLCGLDRRRTLMTTPITRPEFAAAAHGLLASDGTPATLIRDSVGFPSQRIIAMIVNIGCAIAQSGAASPEDIDKAVQLGLNYPYGPFGFGDTYGAAKILAILEAMHGLTGDPRYRPTPWLRRRAQLGVSLLTEES